MAKVKKGGWLKTETNDIAQGREAMYSSMPAESRQTLNYGELNHHPDNFKLVGELDEKKKNELKNDMLKNGIREPLHVWFNENKWLVVSGNERLAIINDLGGDERKLARLENIGCVVKKFETNAEARAHIVAVNENRKLVRMSPSEKLLGLFPPEEYPLLYWSLRGNYAEGKIIKEVVVPWGTITLERPGNVAELSESKKLLKLEVSRITGYTDAFIRKTVAKILSDKETKRHSIGEKDKKEIEKSRRYVSLNRHRLEKLRLQISELEKKLRPHYRKLRKYGIDPDSV